MDAAKIRLAEKIDTWVLHVVNNGGGDEQLLEGMSAYMDTFKQLLDSCSKLEMTLLCQQYDGFYRFANLLERLAQGIADGVIQVPPGAPLPKKSGKPKRTRPPKPKPRRHQEKQHHPPLVRRSIDYLPVFTELIIGIGQQTDEQYESFLEARPKPHVLDDAIIDRAIRLYEGQLEGIPHFEQQLSWLLEDAISDAQRYQVGDLLSKLPPLHEKTAALLALLAELRRGTIDRILEMDDEELGRRFLRGDLGDL